MNVKNRQGPLLAAAAIMLAATAVAAPPVLAQNAAACQAVTFSADVLSRFPNASQECLDVIERDGQQYAVFKAQLIRADGDKLRIRMKQPDGSLAEAITVKPRQKLRVLVNGEAISVDQLAPNQELTAYVRVDKAEIALAPAAPTEPLELEPVVVQHVAVASAHTGPAMPKTAGQAGVFALLAVLNLLVALVSVILRRVIRRDIADSPASP